MSKKYLTPEGLERIKKELEYLKNQRRKELAEQLERSIGFGDISENAEFQEAKEQQAFVEGRILELEELIKSAETLPKVGSRDKVEIGCAVLVSSGKEKEQFYIVGPQEANPMEGRISIDSPVGRALLNQPKGAEIIVNTPEGNRKYKIIKII